MTTIRMRRETTSDGVRWWIENWQDYIAYLKANDLPVPTQRYAVFISHETKADAGDIDFEKQVPLLFHLKKDRVDHEFVTG